MSGKKTLFLAIFTLVLAALFFLYKTYKTSAFSGFTGIGAALTVPVSIVSDIPFSIKEQVEDTVVRSLAKNTQTKLQNAVLDKIRKGGREGGPAFVQDWRQFLQQGQYRGEDVFRAILADATRGNTATICEYLREPLAATFGAREIIPDFVPAKYRVDALQYFKLENRCTLPANFKIADFKKDFRNGGWEAWSKLMEPQNNFLGLYTSSIAELVKQRKFEEKTDQSEATSGSGFTSKRENCKGTGSNLSCVVLGEIKTPGEILEQTVQRSIEEDFAWITSADEFSELLAGVANTLFDSVLSKIDSLSKGVISGGSGEDFNPQVCLDDCVTAGYRACDGQIAEEYDACRSEVLNTCVTTCAAGNTLP